MKHRLQYCTACSLTTDIWSSCATEAYVTLTIHYLDDDWEMKAFVLETSGFPECHTSINIAEKLESIAEKYSITNKVTAVVHDNAANMVAALHVFENKHGWESLRCVSHILQLCLIPALAISSISRLVGAARKLVGHFKHSVLATEELKKREAQMNMTEMKLLQDCPTRWNSTFYMLERLVQLRWPVIAVLSDDSVSKRSDRYLDLNNDQWVLAEELVKILAPLEVATTFLSYEENSSIYTVLPVLCGIVNTLEQSSSTNCQPSVISFKEKFAEEIKTRWKFNRIEANNTIVLAAALDPRFRNLTYLNGLTTLDVDDVKEVLISRMEVNNTSVPDYETDGTEPAAKKQKSALDILLGEEDTTEHDQSAGVSKSQEVETFFNQKAVPRATNPLQWWKNNCMSFPMMAKIAQSLLCTPATSTPSQRVFSKAGLVTKH